MFNCAVLMDSLLVHIVPQFVGFKVTSGPDDISFHLRQLKTFGELGGSVNMSQSTRAVKTPPKLNISDLLEISTQHTYRDGINKMK